MFPIFVSTMPRLNLKGILDGSDITYRFNNELDIDKIAITEFRTSSPPVPLFGTFTFRIKNNVYTVSGNFISLKDVLARLSQQLPTPVDMTLTRNTDGKTMQIVYVEDNAIVPIYTDNVLGNAFTLPNVPGIGYQLSCTGNKTVNCRYNSLIEPVVHIFLENTSKNSNVAHFTQQEQAVAKFLLATYNAKLDKGFSYVPVQPFIIDLEESKKQISLSVKWQSGAPLLCESAECFIGIHIE